MLGARYGSEGKGGVGGSARAGETQENRLRGRSWKWKYLPPVPADISDGVLRLLGEILERRATINVHFAVASLVEYGEPALMAVEEYSEIPEVAAARKYVGSAVNPLPAKPPSLPLPRDPRENMLQRVVLGDLTGGYPFQHGYRFGGRILTDLWIAKQYVPILAQALECDHPFLRRNAVYTLASLSYARDEEVWKLLMKVAERRKDDVAWFRALRILADSQAPGTGELMMSHLPGNDPIAAAFLLRLLGVVAEPKCGPALLETSRAFDRDRDVQWAFLEALARAPINNADLRRRAEALGARYEQEVRGSLGEDAKAGILRDLASIALDRMAGGDRLLKRAETSARRVEGSLLGDFNASIRELLAQHLAGQGWSRLSDLARDPKEDLGVRLEAIGGGSWKGMDSAWMKGLARDRDTPYSVRARAALKMFSVIDRSSGRGLVLDLLEDYAGRLFPEFDREEELSVVALAEAVSADVSLELLGRVLGKAVEVRQRNGMKRQTEFVETLTSLLARRGKKEEDAWLPVERLLEGRESVYRGHAAFALAHRAGPKAAKRSLALLKDSDPFVRQCVAFGLERVYERRFAFDWVATEASQRNEAIKKIQRELGLEP